MADIKTKEQLSTWNISKNGDIYKWAKSRNRKTKAVAVLVGAKDYSLRWLYKYLSY